MMFIQANPKSARVGDCVIRAITIATDSIWEKVYSELCAYGDPRQQIQQMLNSGQVSQEQYAKAVQMANELQKLLR